MPGESPAAQTPTRRWFPFRRRRLLVFLLAAGLVLGWLGIKLDRAWRQRNAAARIRELGGTAIHDLIQVTGENTPPVSPNDGQEWSPVFETKRPGKAYPHWLENLLGEDLLRNVNGVQLDGSKIVSDDDLECLRDFPSLEFLRLDKTQITGVGLVHVMPLAYLQFLDLSETRLADDELMYLAGLKNLEHLSLRATHITDGGLVHLQTLENLRHLDLRGTRVTGSGLSRLRAAPGLRELFLGHTLVDNAGFGLLARFHELRWLDLEHLESPDIRLRGVTNQSVAALSGLKNLRILRLDGVGIMEDHLIQLGGLTELEGLGLGWNHISDKGWQTFKG
jgi:hypothetical protein